ncbi:hypothetical protein [Bacillus gobiensis]|uniref:hypothetical protein n=1 Tax=Bacillus gobiensis TaxID=1441095 RepID=UPI003D224277
MFIKCVYCRSVMMPQDNDYMGNGQYCRIYVCDCDAVYEDWTDDKGKHLFGKWLNPETNDYED